MYFYIILAFGVISVHAPFGLFDHREMKVTQDLKRQERLLEKRNIHIGMSVVWVVCAFVALLVKLEE